MVHVAGYKSRGYRRVTIYLRPDIYMALLLRSINERRDMSAIVNEALESYLNGAPSRPVAQAPGRPGVPQGINQGVRAINDQSPINGEDWLTSNPWVRIIRSRYGSLSHLTSPGVFMVVNASTL